MSVPTLRTLTDLTIPDPGLITVTSIGLGLFASFYTETGDVPYFNLGLARWLWGTTEMTHESDIISTHIKMPSLANSHVRLYQNYQGSYVHDVPTGGLRAAILGTSNAPIPIAFPTSIDRLCELSREHTMMIHPVAQLRNYYDLGIVIPGNDPVVVVENATLHTSEDFCYNYGDACAETLFQLSEEGIAYCELFNFYRYTGELLTRAMWGMTHTGETGSTQGSPRLLR